MKKEKGHKDRDVNKENERENTIRNIFIASLLELISLKNFLILLLILVKHIITFKNHLENPKWLGFQKDY